MYTDIFSGSGDERKQQKIMVPRRVNADVKTLLHRYGMSVLKRGNKTKLFDISDASTTPTSRKYTFPARKRISEYETKIKSIKQRINYWSDIRKFNKIGKHIKMLKTNLKRLQTDNAEFKRRNALTVALIKHVLGGLNEDSKIPKHDFYSTYIPILSYPLTNLIGVYSEFFGLEGERLRNFSKLKYTKNNTISRRQQMIGINMEFLTELRKMYGETSKNKMITQACNNSMGIGQMSDECNLHIWKFHDILNKLPIETEHSGRADSLDELMGEPEKLIFIPPGTEIKTEVLVD